mmetsp:Transcript_31550/g.66059  ORF Transcript_31550/g.66059 Transcript_31550/m.66059 type:complete len:219 (+) Transcript_31550:1221-1877(+)
MMQIPRIRKQTTSILETNERLVGIIPRHRRINRRGRLDDIPLDVGVRSSGREYDTRAIPIETDQIQPLHAFVPQSFRMFPPSLLQYPVCQRQVARGQYVTIPVLFLVLLQGSKVFSPVLIPLPASRRFFRKRHLFRLYQQHIHRHRIGRRALLRFGDEFDAFLRRLGMDATNAFRFHVADAASRVKSDRDLAFDGRIFSEPFEFWLPGGGVVFKDHSQ